MSVCTCSGMANSPDSSSGLLCENPGTVFGTNLFNYWQNNDCPSIYSNFLFTNDNNELVENPANIPILQGYVNNLFKAYNITNQITNDVTSPVYNPFQETLLDMCLDTRLPGICDNYLNDYCSQYTREEIQTNFTLTNFCGCYVPTNLPPDLGVAPACDALCNRGMSIKKEGSTCGNSVCVISDVNINLLNTSTGSGVTFANMCAGCNECTCIVSGTNPANTLASVGVGSQFQDLCGADSVCFIEDSAGNLTQVECSTNTNVEPSYKFPIMITLIIIFVLSLLIVCIMYFRNPS